MTSSIFKNDVFVASDPRADLNDEPRRAHQLRFRDMLSPQRLVPDARHASGATAPTPPMLRSALFCSYVVDWEWLALELALAPAVTAASQQQGDSAATISVVVNWAPETYNSEDALPQFFSEGCRVVTVTPGTPTARAIRVIHPPLGGGLMHVKLAVLDFGDFVRVVVGSANLTCDDWCNLHQAFFVAEGTPLASPIDVSDDAAAAGASPFGAEVESALGWMAVPPELVSAFRLRDLCWPTLPPATALVLSVPHGLHVALTKLPHELPSLELPSSQSTLGPRRRLHPGMVQAAQSEDATRRAFYESWAVGAAKLLARYAPPLDVLRRCVMGIELAAAAAAAAGTDGSVVAGAAVAGGCARCAATSVVYQASSVGGVTDALLRHFAAATDAAEPYPPDADAAPPPSGALPRTAKIGTPFPSRCDVLVGASGGWCGAITLRYFQMVHTELHRAGWVPLALSGGPTPHTKLLYRDCGRSACAARWLVLGSHNFTADCWAFAKAFRPRNFELSVFVPLASRDATVASMFPEQCNFALSSPEGSGRADERFVFLHDKRSFLEVARAAAVARAERVAAACDALMHGLAADRVEGLGGAEQVRAVLRKALTFHWSKFEGEVHDDFGRH